MAEVLLVEMDHVQDEVSFFLEGADLFVKLGDPDGVESRQILDLPSKVLTTSNLLQSFLWMVGRQDFSHPGNGTIAPVSSRIESPGLCFPPTLCRCPAHF